MSFSRLRNILTVVGCIAVSAPAFAGTITADAIVAAAPLELSSPVPEPETFALMLAALTGLGATARRREA